MMNIYNINICNQVWRISEPILKFLRCNVTLYRIYRMYVPEQVFLIPGPWATYASEQLSELTQWHQIAEFGLDSPLTLRNSVVLIYVLTIYGHETFKFLWQHCVPNSEQRRVSEKGNVTVHKRNKEKSMNSAKDFILVNLFYLNIAQTMHFWGTVQKPSIEV